MKKRSAITLIIIFGVLILVLGITRIPHEEIDKITAQCIGKDSVLYIQLGCSHCEDQEEMFGNNYQYLNVVDCFFDKDLCTDITVTPTWIINNQKYEGVQEISKLKELTGC